ncbi:MAG: type III pantothenate kinase [Spirosomataceae bacterium]
MNLVIDSGNTFSKTGLFKNGTLQEVRWRLSFEELTHYIATVRPERMMISSVSRSEDEFNAAFSPYCPAIKTLSPNTPVPIQKLYDTPHTLGADRVAAAVGAKVLYPTQACLVIDMGTCITYDWVDRLYNFHGGIISPGMRMRFKAMNSFTKRLPLVEPEGIPSLIGKNTIHAMQSGVMNGLVAELNGIIEQYQTLFSDFQTLLCGGDAHYFESRFKSPIFAVPELVLIGLNRILEYNV